MGFVSQFKSKIAVIFISAALFVCGCIYWFIVDVQLDGAPVPSRPVIVAHGGGGIPGIGSVSNSKEALTLSYSNGCRLFELDFHWTKDEELVLIHDWGWAYDKWYYHGDGVPSKKEFFELEMKKGLTQMSIDDLMDWMDVHQYVEIVTDVKENNLAALQLILEKSEHNTDRFIPQVYSIKEYEKIQELGFKKIILTLYRTKAWNFQILRFAENHPELFAMTMRPERARQGGLGLELKQAGFFVYAHTINDQNEFEGIQKYGISGIYTDFLTNDEQTGLIHDLREQ